MHRPQPQSRDRSAMTDCSKSQGLGKRFGGFVALESISLDVQQGERVGLIGPNGSGKSTLVNCICGTLHNETGSVHFDGRAIDGLDRAPAHPARTCSQLPAAAAVRQPDAGRQYPHPAALHRAGARRAAALVGRDRRPLRRLPAPGRPRRQGAPPAARPHAGRDAQARTGARDGGRAEAADRRRSRWPACRIRRSRIF